MTDSSGSTVWYGEYLPFGEPLSISGTITINLRFPGQYFDAETGLNYNYFRDYNPMVGRYVTFDPVLSLNGNRGIPFLLEESLRDPRRLHPYSYVMANPITRTDRKGLACGSWWNDWIVPDDWPSYSFRKCCEDHDDCYGCKGKAQGLSKQVCDEIFCGCLKKQCEKLDGDSRRSCEGNARTYCNAVQGKFGNDAFNDARKCCNRGASGSW